MTNARQLVKVRLAGVISPASANTVLTPGGTVEVLPGQGGVLLAPALGDVAEGWQSDHLEVGASVRHPEPAADHALQILACVGNRAFVLDGPAAGTEGIVAGKHGALLAAFPQGVLALIGPGDRVAIDALGVGLRITGEESLTIHSCDPRLLFWLLDGTDQAGRLRVRVRAVFRPEAAGAGLGMPASHLNLDLDPSLTRDRIAGVPPVLRLGDIVAVEDQDHSHGRRSRKGWLAAGVLCHGRSAGGGHGVGMATLLSGPAARLALVEDNRTNLRQLWTPGCQP